MTSLVQILKGLFKYKEVVEFSDHVLFLYVTDVLKKSLQDVF